MTSRPGSGRRVPQALGGAAVVLAGAIGLPCAVRAQAAPALPQVFLDVGARPIYDFTRCDGTTFSEPGQGELIVSRGLELPADDDLAVHLSYTGTLTPGTDFPEDLPESLTMVTGTDFTDHVFHPTVPGRVTASIEPSPDYTIVDGRGAGTVAIEREAVDAVCLDRQEQTIHVGDPMQPVDQSAIDGSWPYDGADVEIDGTLPPGMFVASALAPDHDIAGRATTPGTYKFTARYCFDRSDGQDEPRRVVFCHLEVPYRITVLPTDGAAPTTPAAPADPVATAPAYTG